MKNICKPMIVAALFAAVSICANGGIAKTIILKKSELKDKIAGGWAGQTIGCAYGGPTEFQYRGVMIPDSRVIEYPDGHLKYFFDNVASLYDDIYMDLTFVEVFEREGLDAPVTSFANGFAYANYPLWHANQMARYNIRRGIMPPASGHWKNNPHADCIDFQIEADFAGLMCPAMINTCSSICDKIGHMLNYGDGWYGGVFVGAMYTQAFVYDNIKDVVTNALKVIPPESKFYKCISDVIAWHEQYPDDWKKCWQLYNDKYSKDVGCPELILAAGNIDATMNSAYVVMGLLYGEEDFGKTMDISTRCGQDSDCNPSTAAGVLATMIGYSNIPEQWMPNLREVEERTFPYVNLSLSRTYEVVTNLAIQEALSNGGAETDSTIAILVQEPAKVKLEQSFPDMNPHELASKIEWLGTDRAAQNTFKFTGKGIVVHGGFSCGDSNYEAQMEVTVDGVVDQVMVFNSDYRRRTDALYWKYDLEEGPHTVTFKLLNPRSDANINANRIFYYTSPSADKLQTLQPIIFDNMGDGNGGGVAADFDNDGILDLFVTGATIKGHVLKGTGSVDSGTGYTDLGDVGALSKINNYANLVPVDFNYDGNVDLLAFDSDPTSYGGDDRGDEGLFLGDGTGHFSLVPMVVYQTDGVTRDTTFDWKRVKSADMADFNNDGMSDIVIISDRIGYGLILYGMGTDSDGNYAFRKQSYDDTYNIRVKSKNKTTCMGYAKAYDLNSDGYTDFLLIGCMMSGKSYAFINDASNPGQFLAPVELPLYRERPSFDIADIDNNGLPDLYLSGDYGTTDGWLNRLYVPNLLDVDGHSTLEYKLLSTLPWQNNDICMGWRSSALVDWNGDGFADIIETGRSDTELESGANLDSRATKIRINFEDGTGWAEPILTIGSNNNSVILTDVDNNGTIDYIRNGYNDLAVDIEGLTYGTGNIMSLTVNPSKKVYAPEAPTLKPAEVNEAVVTLAWEPAATAKGNETYEYAIFNEAGTIVAGTNMVNYTTGRRKALTAGNAYEAKSVSLTLPKGNYTYAVQAVSTAFQGSPFATGSFEIESETAVQKIENRGQRKDNKIYDLQGRKATADTAIIISKGKKLKKK
ncbi:MAG: ADP-ribosylglycohydrolase family protein [Bacteroidaceae bacterium]|nr:ADP-ribosylglycohydrolase family protein [Bacteroidaceae bacterium]